MTGNLEATLGAIKPMLGGFFLWDLVVADAWVTSIDKKVELKLGCKVGCKLLVSWKKIKAGAAAS